MKENSGRVEQKLVPGVIMKANCMESLGFAEELLTMVQSTAKDDVATLRLALTISWYRIVLSVFHFYLEPHICTNAHTHTYTPERVLARSLSNTWARTSPPFTW